MRARPHQRPVTSKNCVASAVLPLDLGNVDEDMSQIVDKAARINIALPQRHGVPLKTRGKRPFACRAG